MLDNFGVIDDQPCVAAATAILVGDEELQEQIKDEEAIERAVDDEPGILPGCGPIRRTKEGRLEGRQDRRVREREGGYYVPARKEPGLARDEHVPRAQQFSAGVHGNHFRLLGPNANNLLAMPLLEFGLASCTFFEFQLLLTQLSG
jgi:hypothetical protein